jgi:hypothetical protein
MKQHKIYNIGYLSRKYFSPVNFLLESDRMKTCIATVFAFSIIAITSCNNSKKENAEPIKAYDIDFNWGEGGPNGFSGPGLWADADPEAHVNWYADLGCNVIQSFAVSCNGYAWYKNGIVPEQPGLVHDFLTEQVKLAHRKNMKVFGYFCAGSNTRWGLENPDLSYGIPSAPHIPYITKYIDFLCASIKMRLKKQALMESLLTGSGTRGLPWNLILH